MMNTVADQILKQFADNFAAQVSAIEAQRAAPAAAPAELNGLALVWTLFKNWLCGLISKRTA